MADEDPQIESALQEIAEKTISYNGGTYIRADAPRGKKVDQVARMIKKLQDAPGVPMEFEALCLSVGQKYPQDLHAAAIALELTEYVDRYQDTREVGHRAKAWYVWVGPVEPEVEEATA